ncbi:hypothetical protein NliqN6_3858 [Naganishia liquefaciens]|uniref:Hemolysin III family protein n=1 Tax=Naganishia liquefaciens TaxID=104408 RepID=A0A8H3TV14_9TREE|nr:hypothetical protein NliqN6_3858 [Naganishia liquefaciens]
MALATQHADDSALDTGLRQEDEGIRPAAPRDLENELSSSQQLQALDLQVPTTPGLSIASLRDAILGYVQEAELIVKERLSHSHEDDFREGEMGAAEWHQDAAAATSGSESTASWASSVGDPHSGEGSFSGFNLRKRSQALRRRISGGRASLLPATFSTSPEALLAHLSAIRADVLASMPTVTLPSISVPQLSSKPSLTRLASFTNVTAEGSLPNMMAGLLSSLPARLSFIHEHLPNAPDLAQMSHGGLSLPKRPALGLTEEHKRRIMQAVHSMLPSEDWAGWERLGWEDEDEYQARMTMNGPKRGHRKSWSNGSPEGKSFLRELDGDALGLHHHYVKRRPARRRTVSEGVSTATGVDDELDEDDLEEEVQEEPEYLFPNKTPRAALSRHQSYVVTQQAFEREKKARRRSGSFTSNKSRKSIFSQPGSDLEESDDADSDMRRERIPMHAVGPAEAATTMPPLTALPTVVVEGLRKSQNGKMLIEYEDLPPWMQNNEYIVTGYRFIPLDAKSGPIPLIMSLFKWHNETVNIHSHLLPTLGLMAFAIPYTLLHSPIMNPAPLDILTLLAFMLAAASCLVSSAGWHLLSGCSRRGLFEWGACVDYVGISWLISCSIHTVYYNGFYCQGTTLAIYSMTTLAAAVAGSIAPFQPSFNRRENKPWRILFFLGICFTALAPLTHLALQHGAGKMLHFAGPVLTSCAAYVLGLTFYATHFPECKWPGKFDYIGHSHQIWHMCIVLAIFLHYRGCIHIFEHREALSCALPGAGPAMSTYLRGYSKYFLGMDHIAQV